MLLKTIRTLVAAAAASLLLIGCGSEESTPEPQEPAAQQAPSKPRQDKQLNEIVETMDPDGKGMHLTATTPQGKKFKASIGDEVDIPDEFPKDVPIFPGSTPMAFMFAPDEGVIVTFKSTEEQQVIFDFYRSSLADDGWKILPGEVFDSELTLDATKGNRKVSVMVAGTQGDSRVSVIVTTEI
jgi:hypothetical protein